LSRDLLIFWEVKDIMVGFYEIGEIKVGMVLTNPTSGDDNRVSTIEA